MEIKEIQNKKIWDDFYNKYSDQTFLQSWEWGELQSSLGNIALRLGIYKDSKLAAIVQVLKVKAARGNFLFIPHGPISSTDKIYLPQILKYLSRIAKGDFRHL